MDKLDELIKMVEYKTIYVSISCTSSYNCKGTVKKAKQELAKAKKAIKDYFREEIKKAKSGR